MSTIDNTVIAELIGQIIFKFQLAMHLIRISSELFVWANYECLWTANYNFGQINYKTNEISNKLVYKLFSTGFKYKNTAHLDLVCRIFTTTERYLDIFHRTGGAWESFLLYIKPSFGMLIRVIAIKIRRSRKVLIFPNFQTENNN